MATVYQARYFTGEQLDGLMQKVNDKTLAGRGLKFDADGNLTCTVPGYTKRVFSYTHTTNKELHPTALDINTGIFTAPAHGLYNNATFFVTVEYPYNIGTPYAYLPTGITLGGTGNSSSCTMYYAQVVDEDHFSISTARDGETLTFTQNDTMDLNKFHFEFLNRTDLTIEGLDLDECLVVVKGKIRNNIRYVHPLGKISFGSSGNLIGGIAYDASIGTDSYGSCYLGRPGYNFTYATIEFKMIGERQVYQVNNVDYLLYYESGTPMLKHNRQYFHLMLDTDSITGITMYGDMLGCFYNGTTVEVYAK